MSNPDEPQTAPTTPNAPTEIPAVQPAAEAPAPPAEVQAEPNVKPTRAPPKPLVSDETLAEYQAALAADQAARRRQQHGASAARERAEGFRALRAALRRLDEQPAATKSAAKPKADPMRDDELAVAVHQAPKRIRVIIAATLKALSSGRRR